MTLERKKRVDYTGQRFGTRVVVNRTTEVSKQRHALWLVRCDCGVEKITSIDKARLKCQICSSIKGRLKMALLRSGCEEIVASEAVKRLPHAQVRRFHHVLSAYRWAIRETMSGTIKRKERKVEQNNQMSTEVIEPTKEERSDVEQYLRTITQHDSEISRVVFLVKDNIHLSKKILAGEFKKFTVQDTLSLAVILAKEFDK